MTEYGIPEEAELSFVDIGRYNNLRIELRFPDDTFLQVQFPEGSPEIDELLSFLTRLVNDNLQQRSQAGVVITGLVPVDEEDE